MGDLGLFDEIGPVLGTHTHICASCECACLIFLCVCGLYICVCVCVSSLRVCIYGRVNVCIIVYVCMYLI